MFYVFIRSAVKKTKA